MKRYSLIIEYSEEDGCYLAKCPEFAHIVNMGGPIAHGDSWEEAGKEAAIAIDGIIETMDGSHTIPKPRLFEFKEEHH